MKFTEKESAALEKLTPFEQKVLLACARIPEGETRSYKQIAKAIGKPNAVRAVGNALGKNPLAPLIPCHRVVRSDGKIGGYSAKGGSERKEKMLEKEGIKL